MRISQAPSLDILKASVLSAQGDIIQRGAAVPERLGAGIMDKMLVSNGPGASLTWEYNNIFFDVNNVRFRIKILDIPPWDMDTEDFIQIEHLLTNNLNIVSVNAMIYDDIATSIYPLDYFDNTAGALQGGVISINATLLILGRLVGGSFTGTNFNSVAINRGVVFILYTF